MATAGRPMSPDDPDRASGYGRPPKANRFRKGQSGNPKGRPRGKCNGIPYEAVLGRKVLVRDEGIESYKTAAEAFLLHLARKGLAGDGIATRSALESIEVARSSNIRSNHHQVTAIVLAGVAPGNPNAALLPLKMAHRSGGRSNTARVLLEPWIVEAALGRLGARRLTTTEQRIILNATRTPHRVNWPSWWTVLSEKDEVGY